MKKLHLFCIAVLVLTGCATDGIRDNVINENGNSASFEEVLMLIQVKTPAGQFLVAESLDSVQVFVNGSFWSVSQSEPIDTTRILKTQVGNIFQTQQAVTYLVSAKKSEEEIPDFNTAGEVAQYLNGIYEVAPGQYVCLIESFQVSGIDGNVESFYPLTYAAFNVQENRQSAFVGTITIQL